MESDRNMKGYMQDLLSELNHLVDITEGVAEHRVRRDSDLFGRVVSQLRRVDCALQRVEAEDTSGTIRLCVTPVFRQVMRNTLERGPEAVDEGPVWEELCKGELMDSRDFTAEWLQGK